MSKAKRETKTEVLMDVWAGSRIAAFGLAAFYTLGVTAIMGVAGYYLDQWLGTFPGIFITGLILSFPLSQVLLYKRLKKFSTERIDKANS